MPKTTTVKGIAGLNRSLKALPKLASVELRGASEVIAGRVAALASRRAASQGGAAKLAAGAIKAGRDRVPVVRLGGSTKLPTSGSGWARSREGPRQTVGDIIWGAEFGGGARPTTLQFLPHLGQLGYFLWPTIREEGDDIAAAYSDALAVALRRMP